MKSVDYLIVGHGLAGATLAWQLEKLGQTVAVVDRETADTASRVAAGLISPVTGQRNAASYRFDDFWAEAKAFYGSLEKATDKRFLHFDRTLKVVELSGKSKDETHDEPNKEKDLVTLSAPYRLLRAQELHNAARLDVKAFLDASRDRLQHRGAYFCCDLNLLNDIVIGDSQVEISCLGLSARMVIFCQGIDAQSNEWLSGMSFEPAKGEILEVESNDLAAYGTVFGNVWVVPLSSERCAVGATYDRDFADAEPSAAGQESILRRLGELADCKVAVVNHRAAIRPILKGRLPKIGVTQPRVGFFNGLGSKGALRAPYVSRQLAEHLALGRQVDAEFWLDISNAPNRRVTAVAQDAIRSVLEKDSIAIDATVGNGFDTLLLSQLVGERGRVFGIDLQSEALERTTARLAVTNVENVTLLCGSHADLDKLLPREHHGRVSAVMFNLGYLPRGNKAITTSTQSTLLAINKSVEVLRPGGVISIVAYTGRAVGLEETKAVEGLLFDAVFRKQCTVALPPTRAHAGPPRHYLVTKN